MNKSPINAAQAANAIQGLIVRVVLVLVEKVDSEAGELLLVDDEFDFPPILCYGHEWSEVVHQCGQSNAEPFAARSFSSVDSYDEGMGFLRFEKVFDFFQFVLLSGWFLAAGLPPSLYFP